MEKNIKKIANELASEGITVVEDFFDSIECEELYNKIVEMIENNEFKESDGLSYGEMAKLDHAVLNRRVGERDDGMIDIFNIDKEIDKIKELRSKDLITEVINTYSSKEVEMENINIYFNNSVTNTRGYHADTYAVQYKAFIYLTNVKDLSYGPFSYVKNSHEPTKFRQYYRKLVNKLINKPGTNAVHVNKKNIKHCLASKGTLIIANQRGLHRGMPQEKGKERMLISISFT